jgi:hypothetical protein
MNTVYIVEIRNGWGEWVTANDPFGGAEVYFGLDAADEVADFLRSGYSSENVRVREFTAVES